MKQQFDLSLWLQDKSRKVVTRDGRNVRIVFTEAQDDNYPILALVQRKTESQKEQPHLFSTLGVYEVGRESCLDLFFADEKEELTEFENTMVSFAHAMFDHLLDVTKEIDIKEWKDKLLDLARKELLKDLPKWKKATEKKDLEKHIAILEENKVLLSNYLEEDDYYIDLEDLKTLPKEE